MQEPQQFAAPSSAALAVQHAGEAERLLAQSRKLKSAKKGSELDVRQTLLTTQANARHLATFYALAVDGR
jgi:hypothetical protein